ncbi:deoxyribodipyrimidine photo-lyase [Nocardioides anomalus]|uniref:Deoxyribodipyrimidine photo-lyase n=2 Tax=Nocardioides anomalus TaxID=2712223 RepID=A0A6G6WKE0_9ACTN|nr:deoxyribodipyrimidine photo-lyase [Nocardioides anomalus]
MWFRRDLRLADNPALLAALADGPVLPLFVLDPALWRPAGPTRRSYLAASLRSLDASLPRGLTLLDGDPVRRVVDAARAIGAGRVHWAADYAPYGHRRDEAVAQALGEAGIEVVRTGSPYAVAPGRVRQPSGQPFRVYSPFQRAWRAHGWRAPVAAPSGGEWLRLEEDTVAVPDAPVPDGLSVPEAGEDAARRRWAAYLERLDSYAARRNDPGADATSHLSPHLRWGEVHPRTLLADLEERTSRGAAAFRRELAWREFYADVLFRHPESAREHLRPEFSRMRYDEPGERLAAWEEGRTGFPIVDAGMRQLRATGWMHNRLRMVVASFLVKDLHVTWQHGARHFMRWLADGDLASNAHGWQWTAGTGTDPAPYFRVFNPTGQGRKFDAAGRYVRRWVEELSDPTLVPDPHEPDQDTRDLVGYPAPIVDHAFERREALDRWQAAR